MTQAAVGEPESWERSAANAHASAVAVSKVRERRFSAGLVCVHCGARRVHRWGSFKGRRRYRCVKCRRTFSDLTGTPLAYSKLPWLWEPFGECMLASLTVRAAAERLGIDKDTAWRWRHCLLDAHCRMRQTGLREVIELGETRVWVNVRSAQEICGARMSRRRGRVVVPVLIARDRSSTTHVAIVSTARPTLEDFVHLLGARPGRGWTILGRTGRFGAAAQYAAVKGVDYRKVRATLSPWHEGTLEHAANALEFGHRLRDWLARFRGIACKYLVRYLRWHIIVDAWFSSSSAFVLSTTRAPPKRRKSCSR